MNVGDPAEKALVEKFGVSRSPLPLTLAVAPNGAITGVFSQRLGAGKCRPSNRHSRDDGQHESAAGRQDRFRLRPPVGENRRATSRDGELTNIRIYKNRTTIVSLLASIQPKPVS